MNEDTDDSNRWSDDDWVAARAHVDAPEPPRWIW